MWSFYYRNKKQKAGRWQNEHFGWSSESCSWVTIKCLWLQSLLLFLFCVACSCSPTESPTSNLVSCTESLNAKPNFTVLKMISHPLEMQHSVTQKPVWKPTLLRLLKTHSMMEKLTISVSSQKLYNQLRLFKRDLENLSQNTSASLSDLSEARTATREWVPQSEPQTATREWVHAVSHMQTLLDVKTFPAVEGQMLSTLKYTTFAKPKAVSSNDSLDKLEPATDPDFTFSVQSESTLPSTTQSFPYTNGKPINKIKYPGFPSSPFPVTDGTKGQTENGSYPLTTFNLKTSSGYRNNGPTKLPISDLKTVDQYNSSHKPATDRFNLLDTTVQPKPDTSTFSNMLIPSLKNSISLQYSDVLVTRIFSTNSALATSMEGVNTELYSQSSKPTISSILFDSLDVQTPINLKKDSWDLSSTTPPTLDIVGLSSTKGHVETKTPLNLDHNTADISHMTKQRMSSSSVVDSTSVGTFFASSNLARHAEQDSSAPTILHTSNTAQTSEHDRTLDQQMGTVGIFSVSAWQSQKTISIADVSRPLSWKTTHHTDFNTISSVTPSPCGVKTKACVLQIHDPANTPTPKSSETLRLPTVDKSTDSVSDTTVLSTSSSVTPNDGSTFVESTFMNAYSELGSQGTTSPPSRYDDFIDVINENGTVNQTNLNWTSTLASTMSSTFANKSLITVTSMWKSKTSQQLTSTIQPVQKIHTSWTTLYSTGTNKPSQAHTFHKLTNVSLDSASTHHPTSIPAALQRTISTNSVAGLTASLVKTSTGQPSSKDHFVSKPNIVTGPLTSVPSKTPTATSRTMTNFITSRLASSYQSSIKPMTDTTSTIKVTPAPKAWIPQTDSPLKLTIATPIRLKDSSPPTTITSVVTMPLNFHLAGVSFSEQLTNRTSGEYKELEREVKLVVSMYRMPTYSDAMSCLLW